MRAPWVRFLLGLLLLPLDVGFAVAFSRQLTTIRPVGSPELFFLLGITAYLAFHVLLAAPTRAYVFGHELMHAAASWISGGQVKGFKVGAKRGSVTTDKITAVTALAPYLVPVYALLWVVLYGGAGLFWDLSGWSWAFFVGLGAALAFHLVFTVDVLKQRQSDLQVVGPLLSLALIFLVNITLLLAVMALIVPEIRFGSYLSDGWRSSQVLCRGIWTQLFGT